MNKLIIIILSFIYFGNIQAKEEKLILTINSIGEMPISKGMDISIHKIMKHFPYHKVTQEIGFGDSPDFHLFTVSTREGEELISFISFIEKQEEYEQGIVKLNEVVIYSSTIKDEYGVSPGMPVSKVLELRNELEFGARHSDNYLGKDKIWYLFSVEGIHGTQVTRDAAIKANPKVDVISWPYPRWR